MSYRELVTTSLENVIADAERTWPDPGTPDPKDVDAVYSRTVIVSTNPFTSYRVPYATSKQRNDLTLQKLCVAFLNAQKNYHEQTRDLVAKYNVPALTAILNDPTNKIDTIVDGNAYSAYFNEKFLEVNGITTTDFNTQKTELEKNLYNAMQNAQKLANDRFAALR